MAKYYVNRNIQANGDHEVHKDGCYWLTLITSKKDLGYYSTCKSAVQVAKKTYPKANGCIHCSKECHTT